MDAARRHQNEAIRSHGPENFARGEESAEGGRRNREEYDCGDATKLIQHKRREKSLEPRNLGDVPDKTQNAKCKAKKYWAAKDSVDQRVAVSGRKPQKRPNSGGYFTGIGKHALIFGLFKHNFSKGLDKNLF